MWYWKGIILACFLHSCLGLRTCLQDAECSSLEGSICLNGTCACPPGYQSALGGTRCLSLAPYHTSVCVETYQCSRLFSSFECLKAENATEGTCRCQPGHHYFLGSCWPTTDFGEPCFRDEQCLSTIRDPYSMSCNGTCQCAEGYDLRQRGECRKIGRAVGDGCVLDVDCHFEGGACDRFDFICYNTNDATRTIPLKSTAAVNTTVTKSITTRNNTLYESCPCSHPFVCYLDTCVCPLGYYSNADGNSCLPELGSPGTNSTCTGLLAVVIDGICTCRPNFFFQENMRDCVRVSRTLSDSCVEDLNCHSFGAAARCGPPQQWGIRNCECDTEQAIWDAQRQMCRLFSGVGEFCEQDSDCLAGELEIQCVVTDGQGVCTCPDWLTEMDGLCLNIGLELGDECQVTAECTETPNTVCDDGRCSCDSNGFTEVDGVCVPIIGGACTVDDDCEIENTVCVNTTRAEDEYTCQCDEQFIEYDEECLPVAEGYEAECDVTEQCIAVLGSDAICSEGRCLCSNGHHYRDSFCWPITGLFESCTRTSQCYLSDLTYRTVCRNSLCQCDFQFPYSEELDTCTDDGASIYASAFTMITALLYLSLN